MHKMMEVDIYNFATSNNKVKMGKLMRKMIWIRGISIAALLQENYSLLKMHVLRNRNKEHSSYLAYGGILQ